MVTLMIWDLKYGIVYEKPIHSVPHIKLWFLGNFSFFNLLQILTPIYDFIDNINKILKKNWKIASQFLPDILVQGRFSLRCSPRCNTSVHL